MNLRFVMTLTLSLSLAAAGCTATGGGPRPAADEAAVTGRIAAQPHAAYREKSSGSGGGGNYRRSASPGGSGLVDYAHLDSLYVCLSPAASSAPRIHRLTLTEGGSEPSALGLARGDRLELVNRSDRPLTLYLTDRGEGYQELGSVAPGARREVTVELTGELLLGSDEEESLGVPLLAVEDGECLRRGSGERYRFDGLAPGAYRLHFWYWRLGDLIREVRLDAGQVTAVDETLSVDRFFAP